MFSSGVFLLFCSATCVSADDATDLTERPVTAPEESDADKFLGNCGNQRIIKTAHGLLLQANGPEWKVDQSNQLPPKLSTYWTGEVRGEMVSFSRESHHFLRGRFTHDTCFSTP